MRRQGLIGVGVGIMIGATFLKIGGMAGTIQMSNESQPTAAIERYQVEEWLEAHDYTLVKKSDWQAQQEKVTELEATAAMPKSPTVFSIYISPGFSVSKIEQLLVNAGLLPKENRFAQVIAERGASRHISVGFYTFKEGQTEEEIVDMITHGYRVK